MSEIKLLPCPFCGGEVIMDKFYESMDGRQDKFPKIKCRKCSLAMGLTLDDLIEIDKKFNYHGGYRSDNKELVDGMHQFLVDKWNTRKSMERIVERIENVRQKYQRLQKEQGEKEDEAMNIHFRGVMKIVKEEGGIDG